MSSLTSSSTLAEIQAAYYDNASWEEDASTTKALAFVTACRFLLLKLPKRVAQGGRGGNETELDPSIIRAELNAARQWLAFSSAAATGGGVKHVSLEGFRG